MTTDFPSGVTWRKASYSGQGGNCVEVAVTPDVAGIRDTKSREAGHLEVAAPAFRAFLAAL